MYAQLLSKSSGCCLRAKDQCSRPSAIFTSCAKSICCNCQLLRQTTYLPVSFSRCKVFCKTQIPLARSNLFPGHMVSVHWYAVDIHRLSKSILLRRPLLQYNLAFAVCDDTVDGTVTEAFRMHHRTTLDANGLVGLVDDFKQLACLISLHVRAGFCAPLYTQCCQTSILSWSRLLAVLLLCALSNSFVLHADAG